tara:strand:- start:70 stop:579 length:510 start_codon:yes stop_codon:yes gene_type:complete
MSLTKVATYTASNSSTIDITGITTDDNYMLTITNLVPTTDNAQLRGRVLKSGSAQTGLSYDYASEEIKAHTAFGATSGENYSYFRFEVNVGSATGEMANGILYLMNFNSSSDYDFISTEWAFKNNGNNTYGNTGGGVHTVTSASNGIQFYFSTGNISTGTFTLYKITGA